MISHVVSQDRFGSCGLGCQVLVALSLGTVHQKHVAPNVRSVITLQHIEC